MNTTTSTKPSAACLVVKVKTEPTPRQRELGCDAFSYYSNKFNLMKTLLLKGDDVEVLHSAGITFQGPAAKRRKGSNSQPIQVQDGGVRQTRISFEVHPDMIFDDFENFRGMVDQMTCVDVSDDDTEEEEEEEDSDDKDSGGATTDEEGKDKKKKDDDDYDDDDENDSRETLIALRNLLLGM
jgi:hypothetical protein